MKGHRVASYLFTVLVLLLLSPLVWAGPYLTVTFLDVGEGESIYIETPSGRRLLVDTGNPLTGSRIVEFLKNRGIRRLDAIFITHPHPDHMGGVFHLLPAFDIDTIYDNGQPVGEMPRCDIYRWYEEAVRKGGVAKGYKALKVGDVLEYDGVEIEVLWPDGLSSDWNRNSMVLRLVYRDVAFLFMGDAIASVEEGLVKDGGELRAQVLKVGHHGAGDATTEALLDKVLPAYAVISIDRDNIRGYPSHATLTRLRSRGVKVFKTFMHGNIEFRVDDHSRIQVSTYNIE